MIYFNDELYEDLKEVVIAEAEGLCGNGDEYTSGIDIIYVFPNGSTHQYYSVDGNSWLHFDGDKPIGSVIIEKKNFRFDIKEWFYSCTLDEIESICPVAVSEYKKYLESEKDSEDEPACFFEWIENISDNWYDSKNLEHVVKEELISDFNEDISDFLSYNGIDVIDIYTDTSDIESFIDFIERIGGNIGANVPTVSEGVASVSVDLEGNYSVYYSDGSVFESCK